jgi:protein involved in polysaccharide export with SLBB domain
MKRRSAIATCHPMRPRRRDTLRRKGHKRRSLPTARNPISARRLNGAVAPATLPARAQGQESAPLAKHASGRDILASRAAEPSLPSSSPATPEGEAMANAGAASNSPQVGTGAALPEDKKLETRAATATPATQPAIADAAANRSEQGALQDAQSPAQPPAQSPTQTPPLSSQYLLAYNVTRQQAAELSEAVSQPALNQSAQVIATPAEPAFDRQSNEGQLARRRAATEPTSADNLATPIQAGEALRCTLVNGSVSEQFTVDDEGNVTLPQLGSVRAAGLTPKQLADVLSEKTATMMQSKKSPDEGWTVERVAQSATLGGQAGVVKLERSSWRRRSIRFQRYG